ncbi:hypothetical protein G7074_15565 [Pedobacter sp. HDW13]|uniref:hypothetical protein n=1 Tax=Pedobacter sp. HDW13 TaxID=2714940 RepID=UPI00140CC708|nr:hypothetical protein [Pedobacter sp. HDW13]QIL37807.1 hypothetical protein G7074_15565 [Pedobacter sp. HDW13]
MVQVSPGSLIRDTHPGLDLPNSKQQIRLIIYQFNDNGLSLVYAIHPLEVYQLPLLCYFTLDIFEKANVFTPGVCDPFEITISEINSFIVIKNMQIGKVFFRKWTVFFRNTTSFSVKSELDLLNQM